MVKQSLVTCLAIIIVMLLLDDHVTANENTSKGDDKVNPSDVLVVIRNMHYKSSIEKAKRIKQRLLINAKKINKGEPEVLMMHEEWAPYAGWTIISILERLHRKYGESKKWIYFCEDTTQVYLKGLLRALSRFQFDQKWFLGHALHDHEPSIIHHFAFHTNTEAFKFPDFDAGWAMSMPLLNHTVDRLSKKPQEYTFSIDVKHEVAKYIYEDGEGTSLTNVPEFCINVPLKQKNCVSTVQREIPECGSVDPDDILVAVKTCEKYHKDRVPVVMKTIGKDAKHIRYYSDKVDESIPTEHIGVENTNSGHCQKLHNIIKKAATEEWKDKKWLVVIDDDTIMSYERLRKHLACYDPTEIILLGERYGYGINHKTNGYEYPTGGGGMILSRAGIDKLLRSDCSCHKADSPDDMWLGMCFRRFGINMVHSNSLHQSRPSQYNKEFLSHRYIVSFHKHFMVDPLQVYQDYLLDEPDKEKDETSDDQIKKEEL